MLTTTAMEALLAHEPWIRGICSAAVLVSVAVWEAVHPARQLLFSRWRRWPSNLAVMAIGAFAVRALFPIAAVSLAAVCGERGWGLLNVLELPGWASFLIGFVVLDLAIYLQHVIFHAVPVLWRLHRMHHIDLDFDVTTGGRFHPFEILLSMLLKMAVVLAIGPSAATVLIFEVVLNATSMFNHANSELPRNLDRALRWLVVTPNMHRIHHSAEPTETNSNFGFNLPWWDRLFGTYRRAASAETAAMKIGIDEFREPKELTLGVMLLRPFAGSVGKYPIGRRGS